MTAAPFSFAGHRLMLDPAGALWWPERHLLAVADLHLEKGSACAVQGSLVPPWDTRATLDRLALLLRRYAPRRVVALGDSFHDEHGAGRLLPAEAARLSAMAAAHAFLWIRGNHDPSPPAGLPGETAEWWEADGIVFRHEAGGNDREICGHYHPKASVATRAGTVTRAVLRRLAVPPGAAGVRRVHRRAGHTAPGHRRAVSARRTGLPARARPAVQLRNWPIGHLATRLKA